MFTYQNISNLIRLKELKVKDQLRHIENIKKLVELYPDIEECYDDNVSWIVSESINSIADRCIIDKRNNIIELYPFVQTEFGKVASCPPCLVIGTYECINEGRYTPIKDLDVWLFKHNMSEFVIECVHEYFRNPSWRKECTKKY